MGDPISMIVWLIVVCVFVWLVFYVLRMMPIPDPIKTIITVLVALICIVWLLQRSGMMAGL